MEVLRPRRAGEAHRHEFTSTRDYITHLDRFGVERGLVIPNYGIPVQSQPFGLQPALVLDSVSSSERLAGALWVSFLPQNRELTLEALKHAGELGIVALKTTFLLGGNPDPSTWDEATAEVAEACSLLPSRTTWCSTSIPAQGERPTSTTSSRW